MTDIAALCWEHPGSILRDASTHVTLPSSASSALPQPVGFQEARGALTSALVQLSSSGMHPHHLSPFAVRSLHLWEAFSEVPQRSPLFSGMLRSASVCAHACNCRNNLFETKLLLRMLKTQKLLPVAITRGERDGKQVPFSSVSKIAWPLKTLNGQKGIPGNSVCQIGGGVYLEGSAISLLVFEGEGPA